MPDGVFSDKCNLCLLLLLILSLDFHESASSQHHTTSKDLQFVFHSSQQCSLKILGFNSSCLSSSMHSILSSCSISTSSNGSIYDAYRAQLTKKMQQEHSIGELFLSLELLESEKKNTSIWMHYRSTRFVSINSNRFPSVTVISLLSRLCLEVLCSCQTSDSFDKRNLSLLSIPQSVETLDWLSLMNHTLSNRHVPISIVSNYHSQEIYKTCVMSRITDEKFDFQERNLTFAEFQPIFRISVLLGLVSLNLLKIYLQPHNDIPKTLSSISTTLLSYLHCCLEWQRPTVVICSGEQLQIEINLLCQIFSKNRRAAIGSQIWGSAKHIGAFVDTMNHILKLSSILSACFKGQMEKNHESEVNKLQDAIQSPVVTRSLKSINDFLQR